jgi:hypothetical protein
MAMRVLLEGSEGKVLVVGMEAVALFPSQQWQLSGQYYCGDVGISDWLLLQKLKSVLANGNRLIFIHSQQGC